MSVPLVDSVAPSSGSLALSNGGDIYTWVNSVLPTITLNGTATAAPTFYAPTATGTSGQVLAWPSSGSTPIWTTAGAVPTITLNGTATAVPSFYAPTSAGTSGYILQSSGSGAPTWLNGTTKFVDLTSTQTITGRKTMPWPTFMGDGANQTAATFLDGLSETLAMKVKFGSNNVEIDCNNGNSVCPLYIYSKPIYTNSPDSTANANEIVTAEWVRTYASGTYVASNAAIAANTSGLYIPTWDSKGLITGVNIEINPAISAYNTIYAPTEFGLPNQYLTGVSKSAPVWTTYSTSPTSGSTALITSGGVYTALQNYVDLTSAQNINADKTVTDHTLYFKDLEQARGDTFSANAWLNGAIRFIGSDGMSVSRIQPMFTTDGNHYLSITAYNNAGTENGIRIFSNGNTVTDGVAYANMMGANKFFGMSGNYPTLVIPIPVDVTTASVSVSIYQQIIAQFSNGSWSTIIENQFDGATRRLNLGLNATRTFGSDAWFNMGLASDSTGTGYAYAPTTPDGSNGNQIVTANYANAKYVDLTSAQSISGAKTFTLPISSSVQSGTWAAGMTGTAIINHTASGNAYTALIKTLGPNGAFTLSSYNGSIHLYYSTNDLINAGTNSYTYDALLLNDSGNASFPSSVSANNFTSAHSTLKSTQAVLNFENSDGTNIGYISLPYGSSGSNMYVHCNTGALALESPMFVNQFGLSGSGTYYNLVGRGTYNTYYTDGGATAGLHFLDANSVYECGIDHQRTQDNGNTSQMFIYATKLDSSGNPITYTSSNNSTSNGSYLYISCNANSAYTWVIPPTTADNDGQEIATTHWVNARVQSNGGPIASWSDARNGYIKFYSGFTVQWGVVTQSSSTSQYSGQTTTVTLPIAMTTTNYSCSVQHGDVNSYFANATPAVSGTSTSNFTIYTYNNSDSTAPARTLQWIVAGF